ncbi:Autophagy protein 7 [Exophiala dermatitidis]|uniref:Ubiquitin-like modifier-activating enzyme ATG7 n=2 Tax=Exophiala dermatitidis TaxID=5970 RepID=H6C9T1_EXODN|nr:autophagy-like protein 7 [Exophiala dermatitidis NIH/UT8656]KAJ4507320.1 Autophagy protein 7 [Exophiala dermatitidis]EHY59934.1 autophagy-like protein 7 [Exophiala dermatitidis NIH/UT8656]KAJ4509301.1 Autophagy protein 7 [Exophiala dermatitidis]KAJ4509488.1 Autophagy protein 7 [Exophiala dermatitidis]KAJ4530487.1 Autophagy protein 7 [Exophiala dermatitidis]
MQYVPFASDIEIPFYAALASHKINHDKLDDSARKLLGLYEIRPGDAKEHSCRMQIRANALTSDEVPAGCYRAEGMIKNFNTIEDYRNSDKLAMIQQAGKTIWEAINDGTIYSCPSLLVSFLVLSYADLKKYKFYYWFAFPALVMDPPWAPVGDPETSTTAGGVPHKKLNSIESTTLVDAVMTWKYGVDPRQHGFFLAKKVRANSQQNPFDEDESGPTTPRSPLTPTAGLAFDWQVSALASYEAGFFDGIDPEDRFVCFADPSNYGEPGPVAPGWMLRNLLVLVRQRWNLRRVQILCYRETQMRRDAARSVIFDMQVPLSKQEQEQQQQAQPTDQQQQQQPDAVPKMPKVVGWERNAANKLAGRMADLTEYMDPKKLADSSVDLNLKLMKWRISPNLDLERIKETKCLLLGAGTLGSYVSRNLLGWGVRKITFVDNGSVSFSNPVRQPLFTFNDCLEGGKKKALAAADALRQIYPGVEAEGHVISVPMAGHPVTDAAKTKEDYETLKRLVDDHDVIFLLMDTREARWLPTVMGKAAGKVVMNAALGFDTYVVMRHGVKPQQQIPPRARHENNNENDSISSSANSDSRRNEGKKKKQQQQDELGCYFCNDVVAPADSMKDLTLDQQCTVTRPGIAAIASALLVELLISVLQHPLGAAAPASTSPSEDRGDHPLGLVPHQIRGFLSNFTNINIAGKAYDCCSACSDKVLTAYESDGWEFVQKALNDKDYVEELSGLKEVQRAAEAAAADIEFSEDEMAEDDDDEGELV